jgi:hypothetical protein
VDFKEHADRATKTMSNESQNNTARPNAETQTAQRDATARESESNFLACCF